MFLSEPAVIDENEFVPDYLIEDESPYKRAVSYLKKDLEFPAKVVKVEQRHAPTKHALALYISKQVVLSEIETIGEERYNALVKSGSKEIFVSESDMDKAYDNIYDTKAIDVILNRIDTVGYKSQNEMYKDYLNEYTNEMIKNTEAEAIAKAEKEAKEAIDFEKVDQQEAIEMLNENNDGNEIDLIY